MGGEPDSAQLRVRVDHHVHLFSPASHAVFTKVVGRDLPAFGTKELLAQLDADGVECAVALSLAYFFDSPLGSERDEGAVAAENDWLADQAARSDGRIVAFFSVNPLGSGALDEIDRCAALGRHRGLKLHLANSGVDLHDPHHLGSVGEVVRTTASHGLPLVVHLRTDAEHWSRGSVERFCSEVAGTGAVIQFAHVGGWGGYDDATADALDALVGYASSNDVLMDLSAVVRGRRGIDGARLTEQLRILGLDRVLFGTDWPEWTAARYADDLRAALALTSEELAAVVENRAPWVS